MKKIYAILTWGLMSCGIYQNVHAQYASSGVGRYKNQIYWLSWQQKTTTSDPNNTTTEGLVGTPSTMTSEGASISDGTYTWNIIPGKVKLIGTISSSNNLSTKNTDGEEWSVGFQNMYKGLNLPGLINTVAGYASFNISLQMEIYDGSNWVTATSPGLVIADAESVNSGESFYATMPSTGTAWRLIDYNGGAWTNVSTSTYEATLSAEPGGTKLFVNNTGNSSDNKESAVFYAKGTMSLTDVGVYGTGNQIITLGIVLPFDHGDAPASYGDASHYQETTDIGSGSLALGTTNMSTAAPALTTNYTTSTSVYLGSQMPDADGNPYYSTNASGDDTSNVADEDGVVIPELKLNTISSQHLTATVTNKSTASSAAIKGWLDKNKNGAFDEDESIIVDGVPVANDASTPSTATFEISLPSGLNAGYYIARFRATTSVNQLQYNNISSGSGAADGEVEDYQIHVKGYTISGTVVNDGNGIADNAVSGTAISAVSATPLYAYLTDADGNIVAKQAVTSGSYSFEDLDPGTYKVYISTDATLAIGTTPTSYALPTGWNVSAVQNGDASKSDQLTYATVAVSLADDVDNIYSTVIGLNNAPVANDGTTITLENQPAQDAILSIPELHGTDNEDGVLGSGNTLVITQLPSNGTLLYDGVAVTAGQVISDYDPSKLKFEFSGSGYNSVTFSYKFKDADGILSNEASQTILIPYSLPVKLSAFAGIYNGNSIALQWTTVSEINFKEFDIEKSYDGSTWTGVGTVVAKGNGNATATNYTYTDAAVAAGTVYYRLKMVDLDNAAEYSNTIAVNSGSNGSVAKVYPNPVGKGVRKLYIQLSSDKAQDAFVRIVSVTGQTLLSKTVNVKAGQNLLSIDLNAIQTKGNVILNVSDPKGAVLVTKTVLIQ